MISEIIPLAMKETTKKIAAEIMAAVVDEDYQDRAIEAKLLRNKTLRALIRSMMAEWLIMRNPTGQMNIQM